MLESRHPTYPQLLIFEDGRIVGPSGRELNPFPDKLGYRHVSLYLGANHWVQLGLHKLVCEAFHGPRPTPTHHAAHRDGNPSNNRADNLRWATPTENEADKRKHGTVQEGERHAKAKLTEEDVRNIRQARAEGVSLLTLAEQYGVGFSNISLVARGKTWRHVSC